MDPYEEKIEPKVYVQRALTGALYGLLMGSAFVFVMTFINSWWYPDIPFGIDGGQAVVRWSLIGLGLALIGAVTCLFTEPIPGLLIGAVVAGFLAMASALFQSNSDEVGTGVKVIVLIFTLVPMSVMSLPIILILRRLTREHELSQQAGQLLPRVLLLVLIAVALGAIGGSFTRISGPALKAMQKMQTELQDPPDARDGNIRQLAGIADQEAVGYVLFQQESSSSTEGYDVRVEYEDGYSFQCVVVAFPGSSPYILSCRMLP